MRQCKKCNGPLPGWITIDGKRRNLKGRKYCLTCSPFGKHNTRGIEIVGKACRECKKDIGRKRHNICSMCDFRLRSEKRNQKLYDLVGTACWNCGYDKGYAARRVLEFHHVDPAEKSFNLSTREVAMFRWEKILQEARKCVLLCCLCHREEQIGIIPAAKIQAIHKAKWDTLAVKLNGAALPS